MTRSELASVYRGEQYCLNIKYRVKNGNKTEFRTLHSSDDPKDDLIDVPVEVKPKDKKITDKERNPFGKKASGDGA